MKQVTLYTANRQTVKSYDMKYVVQHELYSIDFMPVYNSDVLMDKREVKIKHLPVERFCWADGKGNYTREIFAAFDEELRELIGCTQEKFERDVQERVRPVKERLNQTEKDFSAVKDELKTLHCLNVWDSLVWSISKLWRRCNV